MISRLYYSLQCAIAGFAHGWRIHVFVCEMRRTKERKRGFRVIRGGRDPKFGEVA